MSPDLTELVARLRGAGCVFAEEEAALLVDAAADPPELERLTVRRIAGEPLETVLGWAEFRGLRVPTAPGVFVPRRRTEFLAERAGALAPRGGTVVELCCGGGAVALSLLAGDPSLRVVAADLDPAAVALARRSLAGVATVVGGDLDAELPTALETAVDVIVANAPYVPSGRIATMPREARDFEARIALDGGEDGIELHRRIAALAPRWLRPGGALLIETSEEQSSGTAAAMAAAGLAPRVERDPEREAVVVVGVAGAEW